VIFAVPSKGRAGKTKTQKILTESIFFVPENEVRLYEKTIKNKIVGVPNEIKGITKTRNWILKNCQDDRVIMVDDDVKFAGFMAATSDKMKKYEIKSQDEWGSECNKLFDICEGLDYKIFGIRTEGSPRGYHPYKPFLFHSYVTASFMGIINDGKYYFDESFEVKEDYELCLRHIKEKGGILAARFLIWENTHWGDEGGCKDYRTQTKEKNAIKKLVQMYPGFIRQVKKTGNEYLIKLDF